MLVLTCSKQKANTLPDIGYFASILEIQNDPSDTVIESMRKQMLTKLLNAVNSVPDEKIDADALKTEHPLLYIGDLFDDIQSFLILNVAQLYVFYNMIYKLNAKLHPENKEEHLKKGFNMVLAGVRLFPTSYVIDDVLLAKVITESKDFDELKSKLTKFLQ